MQPIRKNKGAQSSLCKGVQNVFCKNGAQSSLCKRVQRHRYESKVTCQDLGKKTFPGFHHKDTKDTKTFQKLSFLCVLCVFVVNKHQHHIVTLRNLCLKLLIALCAIVFVLHLSPSTASGQGNFSPADEQKQVELHADAYQLGSADLAEFSIDGQIWYPAAAKDSGGRGAAGSHTFQLETCQEYTLTVTPLEAIDPDDGTVSLWWNLWSEDNVLINGQSTSYSSPVSDGAGNISTYTYTISTVENPEALALEISVANNSVEIGGTTKAIAKTTPADKPVTWSIVKREPDDGSILASIDGDGVITVSERSGSGTIRIRAEFEGECCDGTCQVSDEADVEICGCSKCSAGFCPLPGSEESHNGSVDTVIYLGSDSRGKSAGRLFMQSEQMTPELATPAALRYDEASPEVEVIKWGTDCWLRQLMAPQALADIVVIDDFSYEIRFYYPEDAGSQNSLGFYEPTGTPFVVWTVENPDALATDYDRLRLTKTVGTDTIVSAYTWTDSTQTWTLSTGNGLKHESKQEQQTTTGRVVTRTLTNGSGVIASRTRTTYQTFTWGEEIIEAIVDPDDVALATTTTYYDTEGQPGYGRVQSVTHPDGSQVEYVYNADGTVQEKREHWKDTSNGKITLYDYTPVESSDDGSLRPRAARVITEQVGGVTISKTYRAYFGNTEIVEQAATATAAYGDPANQRTTTTYYSSSASDVEADKIHQVTYPDGRSTGYTYEQGTLTIGSVSDPETYVFTSGSGTARRTIVTQGPATPGKTTRQISLFNDKGYLVLTETQVYTGSGYERIQWTISEHNQLGQVIHSYHSDGTETDTQWGCCGKTYEQDGRGTERDFFYDDLHRLETSLKTGTTDISTNYTYDAVGRRLSETTTAGSLSLSSSSTYDTAGRITERIDAADLSTTYVYTNGGRTSTVTRPGGATEISDHYLDGRLKQVSGTGVVARYYDYGVNADGTQWTIVYAGPNGASSPMWVKTTTNLLGQTISEERPGYNGATLITSMVYDTNGHLIRTETSGRADMLYEYDSLGNLIRSGLDLDDSGTLENGTDRVTISNSSYQNDGSDWWQVSESGVPGETSTSKTRMTGLGTSGTSGLLTAESISTDEHGNQTISQSYTDRATKTVTRVTDDPFSSQDAESVTVNGLLTMSTTSTGLTSTYGYDALGRRTSVTDPRTGTRLTNYNTKGQVEWIEDAAGNRTSYTYDSDTGRRIAITAAEGASVERTVQYQYNLKGQLEQVSGDTNPVDYGYDDYGRKTSMTTYRDGAGDTTTWVYEEATGLLLEKVYADSNKTTYTYTPEGQRLTRTWARGVDTTYTHDPNSGEVTLIDYSDATPNVSLSYDTRGRPSTITDGLGTRTLTYGTGSVLASDSLTGVTRTYTNGRLTGLNLGSDYSMTYGYDTYGRFETINAQVAGTGTQTYTYGYLSNSDLLESLTTSYGLVATRSYEPNRDVLTQVQNQFGTDIISQYDYISDELAQRTSMTTSGTAFDTSPEPVVEPGTIDYATNELNQYTSLQSSVSSIPLSYDLDGNLIEDNIHHFTYDAENRLTSVTPITPTTGSMKVEYAYDYMSRRTQKQISTYDGSSWVLETEKSFTHDGWNLIREQTTGGTTHTDYYIWGMDLSSSLQGAGGIGGLLSKTNTLTSTTYLYTVDANGNVGQLVDASNGTIAAHYEYDSFGKLLVFTGSEADKNVFRFSTKYYDVETGLYNYGLRYYSPELGRWIHRDPIEERGGLNIYGFVQNNPVSFIDKDGRGPRCGAEWAAYAVNRNIYVRGAPYKACEKVTSKCMITLPSDLRCAAYALEFAQANFLSAAGGGYDPYSNGFKFLHCYANCLLVQGCREFLTTADFPQLMKANKIYEDCTAGPPSFERCTGWCGALHKYERDVFTDFEADRVGLCAGFAGKDCAEACKDAKMTKPETGPEQPAKCDRNCEPAKSCIEIAEKGKGIKSKSIVDEQYKKFMSSYSEASYETMCGRK